MWQNGVYLLNGNGEFSDKYSTMPTASIGLVGKIVQYTGTTTVNYINGYFYKGIATNMPSVATIGIGTSIGITEATVTKSTFETLITESGEYIFEFRESIANAVIGESTGITSASVVKATFEDLITESGAYDFVFTDSLISASIGESTGITSATVDKSTFEGKLSVTGEYPFEFAASTANADIAESTGITSANVVKAAFEEQIDETSTNTFVYNASTASASVGESVGITEATVNKATFESEITVSGEYDFVFDGTDWKLGEDTVTLADYGIVATGTPQLNDTITVTYVAEKWTLSDVEVDLADYGITFEGTPVDTDTIVIGYTAANWYYDENIIVLSEYGITIVGTPDDGDIVTISYTQSKWELDSTVVDLEDYGITYVGVPADGDIITVDYASDNWYLEDEIVDIASYGIVVTGTPNYEDTVVITYASAYTEYSWQQINVQPGSAEQVALLSVTTAPASPFAVGSKYYNSSTKKIVTAVTADTWTGATSADPVFNVIYTFNSGYYIWDGDNLVTTDLDNIVRGVEVDGVSVVDSNKVAQIPVASDSVLGVVKVDGSSITIQDGVISADVGSLENVMYFAPANIGTGDGSSWENAKAFTGENYTAMTAGYTALLKYGTYAVPNGFETIKGKNIIGGFTGVGTEKIKPYVISTDGVWGGDGNTTFNDYATIFAQDWRTQINCYVEGIVFYRHNIEVDNYQTATSAGKVHNCIIANNESANVIKRGVTVSNTLFLNGYRVSSDINEPSAQFVYFTGCHFQNIRDTGNGGGAIQSVDGGRKVYVTNCKFENCNAFGPNNGGGACFNCTVISCIATGCYSSTNGGAYKLCTVKNSCAIGCTADINQGAFAGCTLDNATAIGCNAPAYPAYDPADNTGTPTVTPQIEGKEVITVSSATPSFTSSDKLKVNANYQCGTITSLTFDTSSVDDSQLETTIRFTAGVSFAFSYTNAGVKINGELPTFEEDGEYIILIVNKTIFVSDKIVAGV